MVATSAVTREALEQQLANTRAEAERLTALTPGLALAGGDAYEEHIALLRSNEHEQTRLEMAIVGFDAAEQAAAEEITAAERARELHRLRELEVEQARILLAIDAQLAPLATLAAQYRTVYHTRFTLAQRLKVYSLPFRLERDFDELAKQHLGAGPRISNPTLPRRLEQARELVEGSTTDV